MNIAERIKSVIRKNWTTAPSLASSELLKLYHTNPRLDGVRVIASKCASIEMYLYDRKDWRQNKYNAQVVAEHDVYELLDNPCPTFRELSGWTVRYFVFACYTLVGEAYLLKIRDPNGRVISLSPLSPSWVVKTPTAGAEYWEVYPYGTAGGNSIVVPTEDVICFKDIDLLDPYGRGRGTSESIGDEIQSDEYASKFAKNLFFNDATPSAIIYAPNGNKQTADQIKLTWMQKMAGFRHAKEPMVLTGEGSKFEKISATPQEMDFVNSRKFLRDSANEHYHIPPEIFGILQNSNRSTIDAAYYLLNKNVLADYLRMFETTLNNQLLWEDFDRERTLIFKHENNVAEDIDEKLKVVNEGLSRGVLTVNDWRKAMGYEPDERSGDVYLRNMGVAEVPFDHEEIELPEVPEGEEVELPESEPAEPTEPKENEEHELSQKEYDELSAMYEKKYTVLKGEDDKKRRAKIWKAFDARATGIEAPFVRSFGKAWDKQSEMAVKAIVGALDAGKDAGTAIENLYNRKMDEYLKHSLAGAFINGLETGAVFGLENLDRKEVKAISDEVRRLFRTWVDSYGLELCVDINKTTKKKLRKVLAEAVDEGDSIAEQKKKLIGACEEMFEDDKKYRAVLIARTESCTTMNAGSTMLYQSEGIERKEWVATLDDRTRDAHLMMDGVVIPMGDKFEVPATSQSEGAWMEYAGDPTAPASQTCNCRCTVAPYVG